MAAGTAAAVREARGEERREGPAAAAHEVSGAGPCGSEREVTGGEMRATAGGEQRREREASSRTGG